MTGNILSYDIQSGKGLISATDGNRYEFDVKNWVSKTKHPTIGNEVDFKLVNNNVLSIYILENTANNNIHTKETSSMAIISLLFGIIGLTATWWSFAIPSIVAIITGHIAKSNIKNDSLKLSGSGLANAGLILGYLVIIIYLLMTIAFVNFINNLN